MRIDLGLVTGNYFSVMGLRPVLGRAFGSGDDGPGAAPVMMLTQEYWRSRFGGDSAVIGRQVKVGGKSAEIVGVLEAAPYYPARIDALMNMVVSEHHLSATMVTGRTHRMTQMIARLAPGATLASARAEVAGITKRVHATYPQDYDAASGYTVTVTPFKEILGQNAKLTLWLLMGAAGFVLIIACANVTNLTLMRGVRREHELTVRAALGAGTARLRKLLLVENLMLATAGAVLGLVIAFAGVRMLSTLAARYSTRADEIHVDGMVLAFTFGLAVLVALILSFVPKLASEKMLGSALTSSGKRATGGVKRARLQQTLVVAQVAVSVILLTGAGLLTRTMEQLSAVDSGVKTDHMLTMEVPHDFVGAQDPVKTASDYQHMKTELQALPGVEAVGMGSVIPMRASGIMLDVNAEGQTLASGEPQPQAEYRLAGPGTTSRRRVSRSSRPASSSRPTNRTTAEVVVLNKAAADHLFPGIDPLGRRVAWAGEVLKFIGLKSDDWRTVVGVVANTKDGGPRRGAAPGGFPAGHAGDFPCRAGSWIRAKGDAAALAAGGYERDPVDSARAADRTRDDGRAAP